VPSKPMPNTRLKQERLLRALSQQELADCIGTTPLTIGRWERSETMPSPHFLRKLCQVFEKNVQELGLVPSKASDNTLLEKVPDVDIQASQSMSAVSLWCVPYRRNPYFTGRETVLMYIHDMLNSKKGAVTLTQSAAISGLGGIGKTQTAVEYAFRFREEYNAVFWVRADSYDILVSDFIAIATWLNLPGKNEQNQSEVMSAVKQWFNTYDRWLLILDKADDIEMTAEFMPSIGQGHILLTTRAYSSAALAHPIEVDKMRAEEGELFLLRRAMRITHAAELYDISPTLREQARAIVKEMDALPLALDQAGAYIEETGCGLTRYLELYKQSRSRVLQIRGRDATGHPDSVATTWSLSFKSVEQVNFAAAELLRLCAFLYPDSIPEQLIIKGASELEDKLRSVVEDPLEFNEAIRELLKYSLLRRDFKASTLTVHHLVQAVLIDNLSNQEYRAWAERAIRITNKAFPIPTYETRSLSERYLPHVEACEVLIRKCSFNFPEAAQLLNKAGRYLTDKAQYGEAESFLHLALMIYEQEQHLDNLSIAQNLHDLARLHFVRGEYEQAEPLLQQALTIREQMLGPMHPDTIATTQRYSLLLHQAG